MTLRTPRRHGFTLVELLIIITLFSAMVAMSAPPMYRYLNSNRLAQNSDRLVADLALARSTAIANGEVLRFVADTGGYRISDPISGTTLRERRLDGGCGLAAAVTTDFFPWGMAGAVTIDLSNDSGSRRINVLPTGMVEVNR
ncbi:MAG: GspH/FimT family pseudopilin [Candidatus Krumholzibacteriia bacterium]